MSAVYPASAWNNAGVAPIKILMVDDSVVMRSILERIFAACPDIDLVRKVATTSAAYEFLAERTVDIILLDHEMPGEKGLDALPRMVELAGGAHIVMLSSHCQRGNRTAVAAMQQGASDAIAKPSSGQLPAVFAETLIARVRHLAASKSQPATGAKPLRFRNWPDTFRLQCLGIGASTGGIQALSQLFTGFRGKLGVPLLITQHLPEPFIPYYARQVARSCDLPVFVAGHGMPLRPDHVYVAPGNYSLSCERDGHQVKALLLPERDPQSQARPSVNLMFDGMAECYCDGALGIVLTGIGRDGTQGASRIADSGGVVIAQDSASSVVWGMPGSVTRAGLASINLPPEHIYDFIAERCGSSV